MFYSKWEDMAGSKLLFSPSFEVIIEMFEKIVDMMVLSVESLPRVDVLLFQPVESLDTDVISSVKLPEEVVLLAKHRIRKVVKANNSGPRRLGKTMLFPFFLSHYIWSLMFSFI